MDEALGMAEPKRRRIGEDRPAPRPLVGDGHVERVPSVAIEHTPGDQAREAAALVGLVHRVDSVTETAVEGFERVAVLLDGAVKATVCWSTHAPRGDNWAAAVADAMVRAVEAEGRFGGMRRPRLSEAGHSDPIGQAPRGEPGDSEDVDAPGGPMDVTNGTDGGE